MSFLSDIRLRQEEHSRGQSVCSFRLRRFLHLIHPVFLQTELRLLFRQAGILFHSVQTEAAFHYL